MFFFLDRDGTINVDYDFVHKPEEWTFCEGAPAAIRSLNQAGFKVVVVTNQSGIVRGRFTLAQVESLHRWVDARLAEHGAHIDAWYIAPWHPKLHDGYDPALLLDRKPGTGMFERAMSRFFPAEAGSEDDRRRIWQSSFMAGDKQSDLEPALKLGMRTALICSVHYPNVDQKWINDHEIPVFDTLHDAVRELVRIL
jgi:D-glycero-D-manno-heptose 1,7-bisphosphate phosphatase